MAIYSKLERKYFDSMHSRMEVSTAFHCNVSQLTKALTGVEYHSGLITINQSPRNHVRGQLTKVKRQMHHHLRRPGLHQARKLPRHFHYRRWTTSPQMQKTLWNPNPAVIVHFQKACQHNVKTKVSSL